MIVVGAGHNGLVAANYLAKAGKKVLVLERRERAGGQLATRAFDDGFRFDALHAGAQLRPDIVRDLGLIDHGLAKPAPPHAYVSLLPDGRRLQLSTAPGDDATLQSIRQFSAADAAKWPEFVAFMDRAAAFLDAAYRTPMPRLPNVGLAEGWPLAKLAWTLRRLGGKDMFRVIRSMSMSTVEFTEEWFESEELKAAIAAVGIHGHTLGSMSAGTGYTLMHNWLNRGGLAHRPIVGGSVRIADALVAALTAHGGELRTSAGVQRIVVDKQRATGVVLDSGEEISARDGVLRRRSAPHAARPGRRAGTSAGIRLARAVDQDARLGGQGAPAHRRQARPAGGHARGRADAEVPGARVRRRQVRRDRRASVPGGDREPRRGFDPLPVRAVRVAEPGLEQRPRDRRTASPWTRWQRTSRR